MNAVRLGLKENWRQFSLLVLINAFVGGMVGIVTFVAMFFRDQYEVDPILAGTIAALFALAGSLARPIGGYLADRLAGPPSCS